MLLFFLENIQGDSLKTYNGHSSRIKENLNKSLLLFIGKLKKCVSTI